MITADEIASAHERTAYDVIKALRPGMLNTRGQTSITVQTAGPAIGDHGNTPAGPTEPANGPAGNNAIIVMMDGQRLGGVESLRRVVAEDLSEIRFLTPSQAQYRFGTGYPSGVIVVTSRTH